MHTLITAAVVKDNGDCFEIETVCACQPPSTMKVPMHHLAQLTVALMRLCKMEGMELPQATEIPPEQAQVWLEQQRAAAADDRDELAAREGPAKKAEPE